MDEKCGIGRAIGQFQGDSRIDKHGPPARISTTCSTVNLWIVMGNISNSEGYQIFIPALPNGAIFTLTHCIGLCGSAKSIIPAGQTEKSFTHSKEAKSNAGHACRLPPMPDNCIAAGTPFFWCCRFPVWSCDWHIIGCKEWIIRRLTFLLGQLRNSSNNNFYEKKLFLSFILLLMFGRHRRGKVPKWPLAGRKWPSIQANCLAASMVETLKISQLTPRTNREWKIHTNSLNQQ